MEFTNKTVVVTGAGTGIGRATARAFAAEGAHVIAVGRRPEKLTESRDGSPRITTLPLDVNGDDAPQRIVEAAGERIDVLVNNAGIVGSGVMGELTKADVQASFDTNVFAPILLTQAALPRLEAAGGVVVNISTSIGQRAWPGNWVYAATKASLDLLTRSWGVELAPRGIRVVSVAPGGVDTPIGEHQGFSPQERDRVRTWQLANTPLGRIAEPEEIAWAVLRLASPGASFITAAVVPVDGGAVAA